MKKIKTSSQKGSTYRNMVVTSIQKLKQPDFSGLKKLMVSGGLSIPKVICFFPLAAPESGLEIHLRGLKAGNISIRLFPQITCRLKAFKLAMPLSIPGIFTGDLATIGMKSGRT